MAKFQTSLLVGFILSFAKMSYASATSTQNLVTSTVTGIFSTAVNRVLNIIPASVDTKSEF